MRHPLFSRSRLAVLLTPLVAATLATGSVGAAPAASAAPASAQAAAAKKPVAPAKKAAKKPVAKKRAKKPAAKRTTPKKPAPKKPTANKPIAKKPIAKKTVTKAAPKKPATQGTTTFVSRAGTRSAPFVDAAGRTWGSLPVTFGTRHRSGLLVGRDVARTSADDNYQVNAWGVRGYSVPVPAAATYRVRVLMADDAFAAAGRRVFDIRAEGRPAATGVDIARAVGKNAAYDVTFSVRVTDGRLDLSFVKRIDEPLVSGIEVTGTVPRTSSLAAAAAPQAVRFAPGNVFTTRIDRAPLAPNSAAAAAGLARQVADHWGGSAGVSTYAYGVGFNVAPRGTKRINIGFHNCQKKYGVPAGLYDGAKHFVSVPVPADATAAGGTDAEMTIYDPAADQLWDFWQMRRNARSGAWEACWGGRIDAVSTVKQPAFPQYFGASASGLTVAGGMITMEDMRRGRIDHAINMAVIDAARWDKVSWPAVRSDGISTDPNAIAEGQRVRLDPRLDLDRYDLTPFARMVAEAAQKYGFIVMDKGGAVAIATEAGDLEKKRTGANPWDTFLGGPAYDALKDFPWDKTQVLPMNYGRP